MGGNPDFSEQFEDGIASVVEAIERQIEKKKKENSAVEPKDGVARTPSVSEAAAPKSPSAQPVTTKPQNAGLLPGRESR